MILLVQLKMTPERPPTITHRPECSVHSSENSYPCAGKQNLKMCICISTAGCMEVCNMQILIPQYPNPSMSMLL